MRLIVLSVLALILFASYIPIVQQQRSGRFDYWVGMKNQPLFYSIMGLAAVGFITLVSKLKPTKKNDTLMYLIVGFYALWSLFIYLYFNKKIQLFKWLTSASLVAVAICSIMLLVESLNYDWYVVLSAIMVCVVTVLVDCVSWNLSLFSNTLK